MRHELQRRLAVVLLSTALVPVGLVGGAAAQDGHHHARHHARYAYRHHAHPYHAYARNDALSPYAGGQPAYANRAYYGARGVGYQNPAYGYSEAPYDPGYTGPGAIIFDATKRAAHEPGVTLELSPDAKETATGGPVGGVPGFDGT